jgi:hypothetical protein
MDTTRGLYLGREVDAASGQLGARIDLDSADLLTHGLIVGMTGSGKTGLAVALVEELLRQRVPVLAIDPKGDLANLMLLFPELGPAVLAPWIDPEAARREGKTVEQAAAEAAEAGRRGRAEWGIADADVAALLQGRDAVVFTPGSRSGVPLNVLQALDAPRVPFASAAEDLRDEIAGIVSGLLALVEIEADRLRSREFILLANLVETAWRQGQGLTLETLIPAIADPPFETIGALPLESVYPRRERHALMIALNNLLASPGFEVWREGEPLDVERLLHAPDGRPRLSIVSTAHLSDAERMFVTALLLDKVKTWMRRQSGTSGLRALVYMDEIYGYFPPHPADPPPKRPLLTLLKQARAQGVGIVLATQNPVDLDYKGLANMGVWLVGRLQTEQDRERLRAGLLDAGGDAAAVDRLLAATKKRVFLLHDVHRPGPALLHSRWAMSYLRGPLTREEIARLRPSTPAPGPAAPAAMPSAAPPVAASAPVPAPAAAAPVPAAGPPASPPVPPAGLGTLFLRRQGAAIAAPHLLVKYAVRYKGAGEVVGLRAWALAGDTPLEAMETEPLPVDEAALQTQPPAGVRYADLPKFVHTYGAKGIERALKERLPDKLATVVWTDPVTRAVSRPGEDRAAFAARVAGEGGGGKAAKLQEKLEKKKRDLAAREGELTGRKTEKWAALGTAIFKGSISGAASVLSKNRMENSAEARVQALKAEIAELELQLQPLRQPDAGRLQETPIVPSKTAVTVLESHLLWVH